MYFCWIPITCESVGTFHRNSCELRMTYSIVSLGQWLTQFLCYLLFAKVRNICKFCVSFSRVYIMFVIVSNNECCTIDVKHIDKIKLLSCIDIIIQYRDGYLLWELTLSKLITMISIIVDTLKCGSRTLVTNGNKSRNPALWYVSGKKHNAIL